MGNVEAASPEAFYRQFRPDQFKKVVGQPQAVRLLQRACERGVFHHANLFCGPSGTGKTTLARILAAAVNCEDRKEGQSEPCGNCGSCRAIRSGVSIDVSELDAGSDGGKEEIRLIIEGGRYAPSTSKMKVFIIDEAHRVTPAAWASLLKPLEEPILQVMYILCTSEYSKIPQTVASRCQRIKFRPISDEVVSDYISRLSKHIGRKCDDGACRQIAAVSAGNMRHALNYFQSMTIVSEGPITEDFAKEFLGLVGRHALYELVSAIVERKTGKALDVLESLMATSPDVQQVCNQLSEVCRNVMLIAAGASAGISLSDAETTLAKRLAEKIAAPRAAEFCNRFSEAYYAMTVNMNQKWVLESLVTQLSES